MTITYVSETIAEIKKALIDNNLSKVDNYANQRHTRDYVYLIISQNFMINKFAQIDNDFIREELIGTNKASSHYENWVKNGSYRTKVKLIEHNHYLDILINDINVYIRIKVAEKNPNYWPQIINKTDTELDRACEWLRSQKQIDFKLLESILRIIDKNKKPKFHQALTLKYQAMTHVPTTIEKTMTMEQLCASGSSLWCLDLTIQKIIDINQHIDNATKYHLDAHIPELIKLLFENNQIFWNNITEDFIKKQTKKTN